MVTSSTSQMATKPRKRKVKTGCRTCKIRKVKCDEGRPACKCCLSTGRVCDGYGIWGGGGNRYEQRSANATTTTVSCSRPSIKQNFPVKLYIDKRFVASPVVTTGREEQSYFEYFMHRTRNFVFGVLGSSFWSSVVVQACADEPAIRHAILALGSAHQRKECDGPARDRSAVLPDRRETFLLRHYSKAMAYLQPPLLTSGKRSVRIVLLACLLFCYVEVLRGNYTASFTHIDNGMELANHVRSARDKAEKSNTPAVSLDDSLVEALTRLQVMRTIAAHYAKGYKCPPESLYLPLPTWKFQSLQEAETYIHQVLKSINNTTVIFYRATDPRSWSSSYREALVHDQSFTQAALSMWMRAYITTMEDASIRDDAYQMFGFQQLLPYHTMATIMAATYLSLDDQMVYDRHALAFDCIVAQSIEITQKAGFLGMKNGLPKRSTQKPHSVMTDSGWVSPLFYTALKCRDHGSRTEAIKLFPCSWNQYSDNFYHTNAAAAAASEVMRLEETGVFAACDKERKCDERCLAGSPQQEAPIAKEMRIERVEVIAPEDASASLLLVCKGRTHNHWYKLIRAYDDSKGVWEDVSQSVGSVAGAIALE